jgi:hypothetical protein
MFIAICHACSWSSLIRRRCALYMTAARQSLWMSLQHQLLLRACRLSDIRDSRKQSLPSEGVDQLINGLPNLKDLTLYLHKPAEVRDYRVGAAQYSAKRFQNCTPFLQVYPCHAPLDVVTTPLHAAYLAAPCSRAHL